MTTIAEAFVAIRPDTKGFGKQLNAQIDGEIKKLPSGFDNAAKSINNSLRGIGIQSDVTAGQVKAGAAIAGAALTKFAADSVSAASNLNEQIAAAGVTFGEFGDDIHEFGENAAADLGLSNRAALEAANSFGGFFKAAGLGAADVAKMSQEVVELGADLASFKNLKPEVALEKLRAGLAGETEPLRQLGVFLNEASVQAKAMELGLAGANGEVSDGAKIQARYALILEQTTDAQGDLERTADSFANQQRELSARFEDLQAQIGKGLIPIIGSYMTSLNNAIDVSKRFLDAIPGGSSGVVQDAAPELYKYSTGLGAIFEQMDRVTGVFDHFLPKQKEVSKQAQIATARSFEYRQEQKRVAAATVENEKAQSDLEDVLVTLDDAFDDLSERLDEYIGLAVDAERAAIDFAESITDLVDALAENGRTLDLNTSAGRANRDAILDVVEASRDRIEALAEEGAGVDRLNSELANQRANLEQVLKSAGLTREEIDRYLALLDEIPPAVNTVVSIDTKNAKQALAELEATLKRLGVPINAVLTPIGPGVVGEGGVITAAAGWHGEVNKPTLFLAGEGASNERVDITPLGQSAPPATGGGTLIGSLQVQVVGDLGTGYRTARAILDEADTQVYLRGVG